MFKRFKDSSSRLVDRANMSFSPFSKFTVIVQVIFIASIIFAIICIKYFITTKL